MRTAEEILIKTANYLGVNNPENWLSKLDKLNDFCIISMKIYSNSKIDEEINKLQELERQSFIGWNKEAKKGYLTLLTTVIFHLEKLKDKL